MSPSQYGSAPLRAMQCEEPIASISSSITTGWRPIARVIAETSRSNLRRWARISLLVSQ